MDDLDLAACHRNHMAFWCESTHWGVGGVVHEENGIVIWSVGGDSSPFLRGVWRLDQAVPAQQVIDAADAFFLPRGLGYFLRLRDAPDDKDLQEAAIASGLAGGEGTMPQMVIRDRVEEPPLQPGVEVRTVEDAAAVHDFAAVNGAAYSTYGMAPEMAHALVARPDCFLAEPHVYAVIGYDGGVPVAAAMTFLSHGIAGVYWVGTVERARRRGLGAAVTRRVTNAGFDLGGRINSLQASVMGEPVYLKMGYETVHPLRAYYREPPAG